MYMSYFRFYYNVYFYYNFAAVDEIMMSNH